MGWTEVLTTAGMRALEAAAIASGAVTGLELMERAGAAVAGEIRLRWPRAGRVTVLCGPGNNGGDGYVVARHLARAGWRVRALGTGNIPGPDAAEMKRRWAAIGEILPLTEAELRRGEPGDVHVDAIFGTGLTRAPEGDIARLLRHLSGGDGDAVPCAQRLVAVDAPSGLCLDSGRVLGPVAPMAALTVAFERPKAGHLLHRGPGLCGELVVADLGLGPWRELVDPRPGPSGWRGAIRPLRLARIGVDGHDGSRVPLRVAHLGKGAGPAAGGGRHKFTHGHTLVIAGGFGHGGAARLTARAALRAGAGLVTLAPPASALIEHAGPPDALMRRGVDDPEALAAMLADSRITAAALGPGCGIARAGALLEPLLAAGRPCVLDADALTALAARGLGGLHDRCVLTPHEGEFARVFPDLARRLVGPREDGDDGDSGQGGGNDGSPAGLAARRAASDMRGPLYSKLDAARDAAARCSAVVLLKGPDTVIAAPDGQARIHSAFDVPWLATAGAGDVLAGIITGLLARGLPALDAAAAGAFLHAAAARGFGPGLIADDLPDLLPGVFRDLGL